MTAPAAAQEVADDWAGILEVAPGTRLPVIVHIKRDDAGALSGTLELQHETATRAVRRHSRCATLVAQ